MKWSSMLALTLFSSALSLPQSPAMAQPPLIIKPLAERKVT